MLLMLARVEHVRSADRGEWREEEQQHRRLALEHRDDNEAEAAVREPADQRERDRLDPLAIRLAPDRDGDHRRAEREAEQRRHRHEQEHAEPDDRMGRIRSSAGDAMHQDGDRLRLEREAGQVEDELLRVLAADESEADRGAEHPCEHQVVRCQDEEPDDERNLAQRVGLRLLPEMDEHPAPLRGGEGGDDPDEHDERRQRDLAGLPERRDREHVDGSGSCDEEGVERPDGRQPSSALVSFGLCHRSGPRVVDA